MGGLLLLFPGQGSQTPGMAEHLWRFPQARETFAEASDVLGWDIGELCRHGTMQELTRTDRTQLTILTCSVATWRVLEEGRLTGTAAVGHSLGEYSALVAAGRMTFADAVRVVDVRGRSMQACGEEREGAMAAIVGLDGPAVEEVCSSLTDVWPANYNSPGQVVVSGAPAAVAAAGDAARQRGAKRVLPLPVSGAFHTPFMAGAADSLSLALAQVEFTDALPGAASFFSTTEVRYPATGELTHMLARQLVSPVKFTQSIETLAAEADPPARALEIGPGAVLSGLVKRIAKQIAVAATADGESLDRALAAVSPAG